MSAPAHPSSATLAFNTLASNLPGAPGPEVLRDLVPTGDASPESGTHCVYVVRLSRAALRHPKFARANPEHDPSMPCLYVGMTGLTPKERFANHKSGYKASRWVQKYGTRLLPALYRPIGRMPYAQALETEARLAELLRGCGFPVWQK